MIEIQGLTKAFGKSRGGPRKAIDHVTFTAEDGKVTGFLGPNGAGKSTTMRAALGLIRPDEGRALIDGRPIGRIAAPLRAVGAVLDAKSAHPGRSAYAHLRALALTNGIGRRRVDEIIDMTGLAAVKQRPAGQFSLGMSQRLSIAAALLGDPHNLVLDEPINGLDPEGVKWVRELCRYYASQGRAVLLSSHLMSEVALTADNLVIIGQGRILETTTVNAFVAEHSRHSIRVVTPDPARLHAIFAHAAGVSVTPAARAAGDPAEGQAFRIVGADLKATADVFARAGLVTYQFLEEHASLEEAYMALTHAAVEYASTVPGGAVASGGATAVSTSGGATAATVTTVPAGRNVAGSGGSQGFPQNRSQEVTR
ncbi:ATP-binding cassette domain-containing protein [Bifidobacterium saguinibicoloris]|uniref:ATP-binding cassette domain-containing protein n=1 Tax=Bifidobacterium saguinibicoloris TaxID=2834433 RepID=UPI001C568505|nr:ATP-binding cassette domain-containing protein [Bifidobacterium saguinibicoloris]MBW3081554.1 ATP-binding cassette domain-containing protein [Bifidobacterium saguinibicoloris]